MENQRTSLSELQESQRIANAPKVNQSQSDSNLQKMQKEKKRKKLAKVNWSRFNQGSKILARISCIDQSQYWNVKFDTRNLIVIGPFKQCVQNIWNLGFKLKLLISI